MHKRGFALIIVFLVVVVLAILGSVMFGRSISERLASQRYEESTLAFWLAEAGITRAIGQLKNDFNNLNNIAPTSLGQGQYSVDNILIEGINRRVIAHGFLPSASQPRAERKITVLVQNLAINPSNPGLINYAIETTGTLKITGSVDINPAGSYHTNSSLTFEQVFGMSKEAVRAIAVEAASQGKGHVYTDPPTNQQPVNGITWVDLTGSNKYGISSNWSGSGLLIVNGSGSDVALDIAGDWSFTGMIWVTGKIKISGTPVITGSVFAGGSIEAESSVTGNPTLNYSSDDVASAFGLLSQIGGLKILSWNEL